jgi:GSH-dependent disulfide-bond oxidoreductase
MGSAIGHAGAPRAAIAILECGIDCSFHKLDLDRGDQKKAEYLAINPLGKIPTLIDPDGPGGQRLVLRQSWAILLYLAEKSGKFVPTDPLARVQMLQWIAEGMSSYMPKFPAVPEPALRYHEDALIRLFRVADDHLAHSPYFAGDEITVADLGFIPPVTAGEGSSEISDCVT